MRSFDRVVLALMALVLAGCAAPAKTGPAARPLAVAVRALREQDQTAMDNAQDAADAEVARAKAAHPNDPCAPALRRAISGDAAVRRLNEPRMAAFADPARYLLAVNAVDDSLLAAMGGAEPSKTCPRENNFGPALALLKQLVRSKEALDELDAWRIELHAGYGSEEAFRQNMDQTARLLRDNGIRADANLADQSPPINVDAIPGWIRWIIEWLG